MSSPDENDPIKNAFTTRASAARQDLDLDAGLAPVQRRSQRGQRIARGSAGVGIGAIVIAAGFFGLRSVGSDGEEVNTDIPTVDVADQALLDGEQTGSGQAADGQNGGGTAGAAVTVTPPAVATEARHAPTESEGPVDGIDYFVIDRALWKVINVADDDVLYVRSEPNASSEQIGDLAPDEVAIRSTGSAARLDGGAHWYEIRLPAPGSAEDGQFGWVNAAYLERQPSAPGTSFDLLNCGVTAAMLNGDDAVPSAPFFPSSATEASGVIELISITGDSGPVGADSDRICDRLVIALSSEGLGSDAVGSNGLDEVVAFETETGLRLDLSQVDSAFETELGERNAYVVRSTEDRHLYVDVLRTRGTFAVTFLENPGRIVIDHVSEATDATRPTVPVLAGDGVIVKTIGTSTDTDDTLALPAAVVGYARPFEATLTVEIRDENGIVVPGPIISGEQVYGDGPEFGVGTSDWVEAWGEFEFTINGLAPGRYMLALAPSWDEESDEYDWQELPFEVS